MNASLLIQGTPQIVLWAPVPSSLALGYLGPPMEPPRRRGTFWMWVLSKKGAGIDEQNPKRLARSSPGELRRAVGAEHPPTDDDGIEGEAAIAQRCLDLAPVVADVAPEHVVAELRVLALDAVGGTGRLEKSGKVGWGLRHQGLLASSEGDIVA
ncbi:MAG: hypothetical protein M3P37_08495 [Actinomycetota bacterium]|nr:hypothetical protein [Actinomycetota bacterium]